MIAGRRCAPLRVPAGPCVSTVTESWITRMFPGFESFDLTTQTTTIHGVKGGEGDPVLPTPQQEAAEHVASVIFER